MGKNRCSFTRAAQFDRLADQVNDIKACFNFIND